MKELSWWFEEYIELVERNVSMLAKQGMELDIWMYSDVKLLVITCEELYTSICGHGFSPEEKNYIIAELTTKVKDGMERMGLCV